jgi:hypothetical protein
MRSCGAIGVWAELEKCQVSVRFGLLTPGMKIFETGGEGLEGFGFWRAPMGKGGTRGWRGRECVGVAFRLGGRGGRSTTLARPASPLQQGLWHGRQCDLACLASSRPVASPKCRLPNAVPNDASGPVLGCRHWRSHCWIVGHCSCNAIFAGFYGKYCSCNDM